MGPHGSLTPAGLKEEFRCSSEVLVREADQRKLATTAKSSIILPHHADQPQ